MRALVTGAAGFIGSHLSEYLLAQGHGVVGVDCFTDYYDPAVKRRNIEAASPSADFTFRKEDLTTADLDDLLKDVDVVYHLAAQPGVRKSWADEFAIYTQHNIGATQRLLEAVRRHDVGRFVYASSSSVYGNAPRYPTAETDQVRPHSPYGVTKLAAEHLCSLYAAVFSVPTVSVRYFTVYGPRQRPDMALHRLVEAATTGTTFIVYGDGTQRRDFTYVGDCVRATYEAGIRAPEPGAVMNIAGGTDISLNDLIELVEQHAGPVRREYRPTAPGDVDRTGGSIEVARRVLDWTPETGIHEGVQAQVEWHRKFRT